MLAVKALSLIHRRVSGPSMFPHDEARSVDRPGILVTDVRRSIMYSGYSGYVPEATCEPASTTCTGSSQCNCWRAGVTRSVDVMCQTVQVGVCDFRYFITYCLHNCLDCMFQLTHVIPLLYIFCLCLFARTREVFVITATTVKLQTLSTCNMSHQYHCFMSLFA